MTKTKTTATRRAHPDASTIHGRPRRAVLGHFTALAAIAGSCGLGGMTGAFAATDAKPAPSAASGALLVVGDSLSAEYGLTRGKGWVALLEQRLTREKRAVPVVNASISGDTTSGGRSRLGPLLKRHRPAVVVLELGANDALRGLPLSMTRDNLTAMVRAAKQSGAKVLLIGMQIPPNYGRRYATDFAEVFSAVARTEAVPLVPFLLKGVADATNAEALFQADRIHPREQAHPTMLDNVWPQLRPLLPSAVS